MISANFTGKKANGIFLRLSRLIPRCTLSPSNGLATGGNLTTGNTSDPFKSWVVRSPLDIDKTVVVESDEDIGDVRDASFDVMNVLGEFVAAGVKAAGRDFHVVDNHLITSFLFILVIGLVENIGDEVEDNDSDTAEEESHNGRVIVFHAINYVIGRSTGEPKNGKPVMFLEEFFKVEDNHLLK